MYYVVASCLTLVFEFYCFNGLLKATCTLVWLFYMSLRFQLPLEILPKLRLHFKLSLKQEKSISKERGRETTLSNCE